MSGYQELCTSGFESYYSSFDTKCEVNNCSSIFLGTTMTPGSLQLLFKLLMNCCIISVRSKFSLYHPFLKFRGKGLCTYDSRSEKLCLHLFSEYHKWAASVLTSRERCCSCCISNDLCLIFLSSMCSRFKEEQTLLRVIVTFINIGGKCTCAYMGTQDSSWHILAY